MTQNIENISFRSSLRAEQPLAAPFHRLEPSSSLRLPGVVIFALGLMIGSVIGIAVTGLAGQLKGTRGAVIYSRIDKPAPFISGNRVDTNVSFSGRQLATSPSPQEPAPTVRKGVARYPVGRTTGSAEITRVALPVKSRARIALVVDDLGLDRQAAYRAMQLPKAVTLSFLPYGQASAELAAHARDLGYQILLHLPMEPHGTDDPGPSALSITMTSGEIAEKTVAMLRTLGAVDGVNNHMGSRFTEDISALLPVMKELGKRDLLFLDSRTSGKSQALKAAILSGVPALGRDVFLDHEAGVDSMLVQLEKLENVASEKGQAVAIVHPHSLSLDILDVWLKGLSRKGIQLVPLSRMVVSDRSSES